MSMIPSIKRLIKEDFQQEYQPLIEKVGFATNSAFESIINTLNGNVNFDNLNLPYKDVSLQVSASGIPMQTTQFKTGFSANKKLKGTICVKTENLTNSSAFPTSGISVSYSENNDLITITNVTGLITGDKYNIRLLLLG